MLAWLPKTVFGAALLDTDGTTPIGMVVALSVGSRSEASNFVDTEPYFCAGLFSSVDVTPLVLMTPPHGPEHLEAELKKCEPSLHE
ncbi:MAG: hypothetical protein EOO27_27870 [Comamonadaceae bacterium]|nr:MAG: hypothetical protein EOO27_27870 [Comamonadaceae bacterium]